MVITGRHFISRLFAIRSRARSGARRNNKLVRSFLWAPKLIRMEDIDKDEVDP